MTHQSPGPDSTVERCQHRTPSGRQCRSLVVDPGGSFCARHAPSEPGDSEDFSAALMQKACRFQNAQGINDALGVLYTLLAQGRISPRRASVLAYISSLLLRTLPAIDNDLYPQAGRPAAAVATAPAPQENFCADDSPLQSADLPKSSKPN